MVDFFIILCCDYLNKSNFVETGSLNDYMASQIKVIKNRITAEEIKVRSAVVLM